MTRGRPVPWPILPVLLALAAVGVAVSDSGAAPKRQAARKPVPQSPTSGPTWLRTDPRTLSQSELDKASDEALSAWTRLSNEQTRRAGPVQPMPPEQLYAKYAPAVVSVLTNGQRQGAGTGFLEGPGRVVTCFHVVAGAKAVQVQMPDGLTYPVDRVLWARRDLDLAVLAVQGNFTAAGGHATHPCVEFEYLADETVKVGMPVFAIGDPAGFRKTLSDGILSAIRDTGEFSTLYQITAPLSPGSSGSPVFNRFGRVIGVVTSSVRDGQSLNFCVPISYVAQGLSKQEAPMSVERWASFSEPPPPPAAIPAADLQLMLKVMSTPEGARAWPLRRLPRLQVAAYVSDDNRDVPSAEELRQLALSELQRECPHLVVRGAPEQQRVAFGPELAISVDAIRVPSGTGVVVWSVVVERQAALLQDPAKALLSIPANQLLDDSPAAVDVWRRSGLLTGGTAGLGERTTDALRKELRQLSGLINLANPRP